MAHRAFSSSVIMVDVVAAAIAEADGADLQVDLERYCRPRSCGYQADRQADKGYGGRRPCCRRVR